MATKKSPLVSVIMTVFNTGKYLEEAIESILKQTYKNFEFIIVNDCSNDDTAKILNRYKRKDKRLKVLTNTENKGAPQSSNSAIKISQGKYIARIDGDDWAFPDRLEKQVAYLEKNPKVVVLGGIIEVCDGELNRLNDRKYYLIDTEIRKRLFLFSPFCHPAIMVRSKTIKEIGGYDPFLKVAEDYDLYFRLGTLGDFANLESKVLKLRTHDNSISARKGKTQEIYTLIIRLRAHFIYGFKMNWFDKLYWILQLVSMVFIPSRVKFWIFNKIRSFK